MGTRCYPCRSIFSARILNRQRGMGLPVLLMVVAVLSGLVAAGYLEWRAREAGNSVKSAKQSLQQADRALMTFVTVHRRLPCPDTNRDGLEDCVGNPQKGWLASSTLLLSGLDSGVAVGQLRYLVQRGATDQDLAVLGDDWRPLEYDGGPPGSFQAMRATSGLVPYKADILTLSDFCQRLQVGAQASVTAAMAQVSASPARAVAYALVHAGMVDADGNGDLFDGVNATFSGQVLEPADKRPGLAAYDDVVLERSFKELQTVFSCQSLAQSINTVALGLDVVQQVDEVRIGNIDAAERAITFASLAAAITSVELGAAAIEAASDSGNAAAEFAACAASLGIAVNFCSAAPLHVSSSIMAGASAVANGVSVALNITAAVMAGNAMALADSSRPASALSCPKVDVDGPLKTTQEEVTKASADLAAAKQEYEAKDAELKSATTEYNTALASLRSSVRAGGISSAIDFRVDNLIDSANGWSSNAVSFDSAKAAVEQYQTILTNATDAVSRYNTMLSNRVALIEQTKAEIAALDAQISVTSDAALKTQLQTQRNNKAGDLGLLNDVNQLTMERDKAVADKAKASADLAAAQLAQANAQASLNTGLSTYQNQHAALLEASYGPYTFQGSSGSFTACTTRSTTECQAGTVSTRSNVNSSMQYLMGLPPVDSGQSQPNAASKFMRPKKLQRELQALQSKLESTQKREVDAKARLDDLKNQLNNPPPCNISGSGVTPWGPDGASDLLINVDTKGGTR